jgi:prepilin-type N-terminal cleavage/methylation domain-containing protein
MSTTAKFEKCRARRHAGGFTLAELLVVVSIMSILMAMLAPSIYSVFFATRKAGCQSNLRSIVNAANRYAQADSRQRLPTPWSKTTPTPANKWGDMRIGNPGCLALLIDAKLADRELFLCQEAQSTRKFTAMAMDANTFTYRAVSATPPPPVGISTLSYSYISMVYNAAWVIDSAHTAGNVAALMTMDQVPATLVVLADQNPRCTFGTTGFATGLYDNLYDLSGNKLSTYAPKLKKNSLNHKNKGQNIARWDASVKWITDANNPNTPEDDIYKSACSSADETQGRRNDMNDSFLIP